MVNNIWSRCILPFMMKNKKAGDTSFINNKISVFYAGFESAHNC